MVEKFKKSFKYIKLKDFLSFLIFIVVLIPSLIVKIYNKFTKKQLWIVSERVNTACDNGFHFYKYLKNVHPEIKSYYVIDKKCEDYKKVEMFGNIVQHGSLKHWIIYIASNRKIGTQKASNPSPALFYVLHVYLNLFNNRVYLKHGIIKDDADYWYYKNTKYSIITCGAKDEYDFILEKFGYPHDNVKYTGLARFDNLHDNIVDKKQILIIPTWRSWLGRTQNKFYKEENFLDTDYYKNWIMLLNNKKFNNFIKEKNLKVYFYPHINMKKYVKDFNNLDDSNIKIIDNEIDIQTLLKESSLMVTDYSSVYMDFAYMKKPIIYFQFDKDEYRMRQHKEGYFSYEKNGFGDIYLTDDDIVNKIIYYVENNYKIEDKYLKRMNDFFLLNDKHNCDRIFDSIK